MEAAQTSETLVHLYQSTRRYNPEDINVDCPDLVPFLFGLRFSYPFSIPLTERNKIEILS
jgi:hypothetical protein